MKENIQEEWKPDYSVTPRRIVCAAIRHKETGRIITGARHYDKIMREQINASEGITFWKPSCEQGFIDQFGDFLNRKDAWRIAENEGQIRREVSSAGTLYSENLY
jgi:hypothetical protein